MLFTGAPVFAGGHFRTQSAEYNSVSGVHFLGRKLSSKFSRSQVVPSLWLRMLSIVVGPILSGIGMYRLPYRWPHSTTCHKESREPGVSHWWQLEVICCSLQQCWQFIHFLVIFQFPLATFFLSTTSNKYTTFPGVIGDFVDILETDMSLLCSSCSQQTAGAVSLGHLQK